jgi:hypothetical protein
MGSFYLLANLVSLNEFSRHVTAALKSNKEQFFHADSPSQPLNSINHPPPALLSMTNFSNFLKNFKKQSVWHGTCNK